MSVFFDKANRCFYLSGGKTSYVLHITEAGQLLNLYWGKRIADMTIVPDLTGYLAITCLDPQEYLLPHELPVRGSGWYGTPAVDIKNTQGNDVVVLRYISHEIYSGKHSIEGLPATYTENDTEATSLEIHLEDPLTKLRVTAVYSVFEESGAITRCLRAENCGDAPLTIEGLMSASVPLNGCNYDLIHLKGAWAREHQIVRTPIGAAEYRVFSQRGISGHEESPFMALCERTTSEFSGEVWAMNLVYSGSFLAVAAVDNLNNSRFSIGLNPDTFNWLLQPSERFFGPEAVMVYSCSGFNTMSQIYHELYRTRLVRGYWRDRVRPILINTWEIFNLNFNEEQLLDVARRAKDIGIELFVVDDGWFGKRDQDNCSLGDWTVINTAKLPNGVTGLSEKIHELGMTFGLWFEPEMISPDSNLYRAHPDWCLHVDGRARTLGRNQLILDLSRKDVQDYIIEAFSSVLNSAKVEFVKWDYNRTMTEAFSGKQLPERQMETQHRCMLGTYRVFEEVTKRFPKVLFECCSAGGGRFDPGMLYYTTQVTTSDNTDAVSRLKIQYGSSFVYPICTMETHVSSVPNQQTGRVTGLRMRGDVALAGSFGLELNLAKLSQNDLQATTLLVKQAKEVRELTQMGIFTRLISPFESEYAAWQFSSKDGSKLMLCVFRLLMTEMMPSIRVRMRNLESDVMYEASNGKCYSGDLLMNVGIWVRLSGDFTSYVLKLKKI